MAVSSIAFLNMIVSRMAKPFMCLLMSEVIEAIVKGRRKNDCSFLLRVCHSDVNRYGTLCELVC